MKKKYSMTPYLGFDNVCFLESRDSVRTKLGSFEEFRKNRLSRNTADDFGDFHAFYDESNRLEAVEFFSAEVYLNQDRVFPKTKEELISLLKRLDGSAAVTEDSIVSKKLGISAYAPSETVQSVLFHREGYFD